MNPDYHSQADELLASAGPDGEHPALSVRQIKYRRRREVSLESPAGTREVETAEDPGADPALGVVDWLGLEAMMQAAGLDEGERAALVAGACFGLTDGDVSRLLGCNRRTVIRRRQTALGKLERAKAATPELFFT